MRNARPRFRSLSSGLLVSSLLGLASFALGSCSKGNARTPLVSPAVLSEESPTQDAGGRPASGQEFFHNPVLAGTHPDPSVVRVDGSYYLVVSSFEYFPGVPIFESRDLVSWRPLGHVLSRKSQLDLDGVPSSQGVYAPTIRYHDGTFYMVTTNMEGGGSFYVTATDPAGPWSDPIWVKESVFTMDPSLFFDDDGKVYYTRHGDKRHGAIYQAEIDIQTGKLAETPRKIWGGTGDIWPEGPHLYKVDGQYYLLISEGGTSYEHMITVARSDSPTGPFEPHPHNPILTHRYLPHHPIQATGHGDLVQTKEGDWWMVLLGIRPSTEKRHHIGRETFLAPVEWQQGWPVVNAGQPLELEMSRAGLPPPHPQSTAAARDEFDTDRLGMEWSFVRNPELDRYSMTQGRLQLRGSELSLDEVGSPTAIFQPQDAHRVRIGTRVSLARHGAGRAGLIVRGNEDNHYDLIVEDRPIDGQIQRSALLRIRREGKTTESQRVPVEEGPVELVIEGFADRYEFSVKLGEQKTELGQAPTTAFAYEETGSFTGAYVGLYAQSPDGAETVADFDWFEMLEL